MERIALALALALLAPLADAQSLGRFFFTPDERTELDIARVQKKAEARASCAAAALRSSAGTDATAANGHVRRDRAAERWPLAHLDQRPPRR